MKTTAIDRQTQIKKKKGIERKVNGHKNVIGALWIVFFCHGNVYLIWITNSSDREQLITHPAKGFARQVRHVHATVDNPAAR